MRYCTRHLSDIGDKIRFHGLWKFVQPERVIENTRLWLTGETRREAIDPLVVVMVEISAKADRMLPKGPKGQMGHATGCPLCAIQRLANDETADAKVVAGMVARVVLPLMQSNGLAPGQDYDVKARKVAAPRTLRPLGTRRP